MKKHTVKIHNFSWPNHKKFQDLSNVAYGRTYSWEYNLHDKITHYSVVQIKAQSLQKSIITGDLSFYKIPSLLEVWNLKMPVEFHDFSKMQEPWYIYSYNAVQDCKYCTSVRYVLQPSFLS